GMALGARQAALRRPPAVAVHDAGDVDRDAAPVDRVEVHGMDGSPWVGTARFVIDRVRGRVTRWWRGLRADHPAIAVAADVQQRFGEVQGGYLAGAVTLAMFLSVFPLLLVAVSVLGFFSTGHP